jgi:UDP-galactopyranose mutase
LFDYKFGRLQWRTLKFENETKKVDDYQGTAVMNYAQEDVNYTRIHEPAHLHPEKNYSLNKSLSEN